MLRVTIKTDTGIIGDRIVGSEVECPICQVHKCKDNINDTICDSREESEQESQGRSALFVIEEGKVSRSPGTGVPCL